MPFKNPHPLYSVWQGMKGRCNNPSNKHYYNYGGRGIKVCDAWLNDFKKFVEDMGEKPNGYSIDRINNNGDYTPGNCKWSTKKEQQRNRRVTKSIIIEGKTYLVCAIAEKYGFKFDTILHRAKFVTTFNELISKQRKTFKPNKTHCKNGHEFTQINTYIYRGFRYCKKCHSIREENRRNLLSSA